MGDVTKIPTAVVERKDNLTRSEELPGLVLDRHGRPEWCAENCGMVLEEHPAWRGVLRYDEFSGMTMLMRPIPGSFVPRSSVPRPIADHDYTAAHRWFTRHLHPRATKSVIVDGMLQVARQTIISPVRDYLDALGWDGISRIHTWLQDYLGVPASDFADAVGPAWLISAVARALQPGCKADCALILEGPQGALKSTALRTLAGDDWFFDGLRDFGSKDASQGLRGKWIIEIAELAAMRRSDIEVMKAYMSRQEERFRPAYGKAEAFEPRRCVFAGSTNDRKYLRDPTGNRRFWPVTVGTIDIQALARDRNQLWAEAVAAYRKGEPWWLDHQMEEVAAAETAARTEDDPWLAAFADHLDGKQETSTGECLLAVGVLPAGQTRNLAMRAAAVLTSLGWTTSGRFTTGLNRNLTRYVKP